MQNRSVGKHAGDLQSFPLKHLHDRGSEPRASTRAREGRTEAVIHDKYVYRCCKEHFRFLHRQARFERAKLPWYHYQRLLEEYAPVTDEKLIRAIRYAVTMAQYGRK